MFRGGDAPGGASGGRGAPVGGNQEVEAMDLEMAVHWDFEVVVHQVEEVNLEVAMHRAEAVD